MVFTEIAISFNIILIILIIIKRKQLIEKFKKRTLINKIFIIGLLSYSFLTAIAQFFFLFDIPFNPFSLLPYDVLNFFINPFITFICFGCACLLWVVADYKSTTPKTKTTRLTEKSLVELFNLYSIQGIGRKDNPYVVEDSTIFPKKDRVVIKNSHVHIIFKDHKVTSKKFKRCSKITFENCSDSHIDLKDCAEINIKNSTMNSLDLTNCIHIFIEKSNISLLRMHGSFLNTFEDCLIKKIIKKYSPDNTFNIKEQLEDQGRKSNTFQNNLPAIMILLLALVIVGNYLYLLYISTIRLSFIYPSITLGLELFLIIFVCSIISLVIILYIIILCIETLRMHTNVKKYYKDSKKFRFKSQKFFIGWAVIISALLSVNVFYSLNYFNIIVWFSFEFRIGIYSTLILASAIFMTLGFDIMLRNIKTYKEKFIKTSNPLYPEFTLYNLFLIIFLIFINMGINLFLLYDMAFLINSLLYILIFIEFAFVLLVLMRYRKLKKNNQKQRFKLAFSLFLIGCPVIISLPFYYFSVSQFDVILYSVLISTLSLIGIISLPGTSKLFKADSYQRRGMYEKSVKTYFSALKKEPKNEIGWYNLGMTQFKNEDYSKSLNAFKKVIEINPQNNNVLMMIGICAANTGDFDLALQSCKKALNNIKNPVLTTSKSLLESMRDLFEQPIKEELLWNCLSYIYINKEDYSQAIEASKKAVELNPDFKEAWLNLAAANNQIGNFSKAIDACNNVLKLDNNFEFAWSRLGKIYKSKGDLELALQMVKKAIEINPKEHEIWLVQAEIYTNLKDYENALKSINMALKFKPKFKDALELGRDIHNKMVEDKK